MKQHKAYRMWCAGAAIFIGADLLGFLLDAMWPIWIGIAIFFMATVLLVKYFRCPHCNHSIHPRNASAEFCPYCGKRIN